MIKRELQQLRRDREAGYEQWRRAWQERGYNSSPERTAFERIKEIGLHIALARMEEGLEPSPGAARPEAREAA